MLSAAVMRDVERLREKIQISFDGRQVWALALSALLLLAGAFTVGVLVGRELAALDAAAASEKPGPPLTVPSSGCCAQGAPPAAGKTGSSVTPAPQRPAVEEKVAAAEKPAAQDKIAAAGEAPADEADEETDTAPAAKPAPEKHDATQGRAPAHAPETPRAPVTVAAPRPATVVPAPPRPVQVASTSLAALTPPPRDPGKFTVQIGASQDRTEALRMESRARAAGLKPYAVEADLGAKGTWYRVRIGAFPDKDAANRYRRDVERELRAPAVVMPSK